MWTASRQWFTHSPWPCTPDSRKLSSPLSPPPPQPHSVLWVRESAIFPQSQTHNAVGYTFLPAHMWFLEARPRSGHCVCLPTPHPVRCGGDLRPNRWQSVQLSVCLPFQHFHCCAQTNKPWREKKAAWFLLTSVALIAKLWHVIWGKSGPFV